MVNFTTSKWTNYREVDNRFKQGKTLAARKMSSADMEKARVKM